MAPLKSSLARSLGKFLGVSKQQDLSLRGSGQGLRIPPITASGGTKVTFGGVIYHTFTSSGAFVIDDTSGKSSISVDIMLQGAGGGGGVIGGGGGAGGQVQGTRVAFPINNGPYPVTIGTGGNVAVQNQAGTDGSDTTISDPGQVLATAKGGGGGGSHAGDTNGAAGRPGGCGGGGSDNSSNASYGSNTQLAVTHVLSPLSNFGNRGGEGSPTYTSNPRGGGGGGGTGSVGQSWFNRGGGSGKPYTIPTNGDPSTQTEYWFGGGGGGGPYGNDLLGPGGRGGGGGGWNDGPNVVAPGGADGYGGDVNGNPTPEHNRGGRAATNSGGGGGGADWDDSPGFGTYRTGGPGILVISYPTEA